MRIHLPFLTFTTFVSGALAIGPSAPPVRLPIRLPGVVVKAAPLPFPSPLEGADTTTLTEEDLKRQQVVTVLDALKRVPGVYVRQNGGIGQEARVSLRGAGENNTMTVLNGMPIYDTGALDEAFDLSRWTLDDIHEIRVIRGPMSSLYGPGGIGGVISADMKKGKGPHKTFAKAEAGSFHTYAQTLGIQGEKERFNYYALGSRLQSAGTSLTPERYRSPQQDKLNNPLHQESLVARIGAGQDDRYITFSTRYLTRRLGFRTSPFDINPWRRKYYETFNRLQGHAEVHEGRWSHDLGIGYYHNNWISTHTTNGISTRNGSQAQIDWKQVLTVADRLQLQVATDYSHEKLDWYKAGILAPHLTTNHGGIGSVLTFRSQENLIINVSGRLDKYKGIPVAPTYRLGGEYNIEKMTLKGGIGTAFKAPTLQQRFERGPFYSGNPNLKPVKSLGADFGIERSFLDKSLTAGLTLFQNRIHDLIIYSSASKALMNLDKSRTQGIEGLLKFILTQNWSIELTHTFTQAWDIKTGLELIGNPRNKTSFTIKGYLTPEWQISGDILYVGPRISINPQTSSRVRAPSYTVCGIQTSYHLNDHWEIYGRGENILDRRYESPNGYQQPGLGIYAGVRAQW